MSSTSTVTDIQEPTMNVFLKSGIDQLALNRDNIIWTPLVYPGVREDYYEISNHGKIRRASDHLDMSNFCDKQKGYELINLVRQDTNDKTRKVKRGVHRLVANSFLQNPQNSPTVDHINRNSMDNHLSNLRWATHTEQNQNQDHTGRTNLADRIPVEALDSVSREVVREYESMTQAAQAVGGKKGSISAACRKGGPVYGFYWRKVIRDMPVENVSTNIEAAAAPSTANTETETANTETETAEEWRQFTTKTGEVIDTHMVSNKGLIRSIARPDILRKGSSDREGYRFEIRANGKKRNFGVHDVVASTFIGLPPDQNMVIYHINRDRTDNRVENLEWITESERRLRQHFNNSKRVRATYPDGRYTIYTSIGRASAGTGVDAATISTICNGLRAQRPDISFRFED
jgi:hypothetical protein